MKLSFAALAIITLSCKAPNSPTHRSSPLPAITAGGGYGSPSNVQPNNQGNTGYQTGAPQPDPSSTNSNPTYNINQPSSTTSISDGTTSTTKIIVVPPGEDIDSGVLRFLATGIITSRAGSTDIAQDMNANVNSDRVQFEVRAFHATGGDQENKVDDELSKQVGALQLFRATRQQLDGQTSTSFKNLRDFVVFASRSEDRRGLKPNDFPKTAGFSAPFPVLVIPGPTSRYAVLNTQQTVSTNVNSGGKSFAVDTKVYLGAATGNIVRVIVENVIATDKAGELYQLLPVARRTEFAIDTNIKRIVAIKSVSDYQDSSTKKRYNITFTHELCSVFKNGTTELFGICKNQ